MAVLLLAATFKVAAAQSDEAAERFAEFLDRNRDGVVDEDEFERIPDRLRERLESQGVSLTEPIPTDDLADLLRQKSGEGRAEREGPRPAVEASSNPGARDSQASPSSAPAASAPAGTSVPASSPWTSRGAKTMIVSGRVALPSAYAMGDTDRDGQIGLYEWKAWKGRAAIAEFRSLDRNGDGFLTPAELIAGPLKIAPSATIASASPAPSASTPATESGSAESGSTAAPPTSAAASPAVSDADPTGEFTAAAKRYFELLDADKDGKITPAEWEKSLRIRGKFVDAKVDISRPMSQDDFVGHYVRVSAGAAKK